MTPLDQTVCRHHDRSAIGHQGNGLSGRWLLTAGTKIAVIDTQFEGLAARIAEGELPGTMVTKRFLATGTITDTLVDVVCPHGVACAEVIHDIAPEAQLYLIQSTSLEINLEDIFSYLHSEGAEGCPCPQRFLPSGAAMVAGRSTT